jgi:Bacterial Ig-like domain (group 3)/NHL repeat
MSMEVRSAAGPTGKPAARTGKLAHWSTLVRAALVLILSSALHAQGILTVTPAPTASTIAGTGTLGDSGDGGAATSATLAAPSALAYDTAGNLYFADRLNHVVREVSKAGQVTTVAGTGVEGFAGDNAAATAALLDTPTGVAVDSAGNLYIADSHNHRIRKVSGGTITTIAGTGVAGFAGDGGPATSAQLSLPTAVALDPSGSLYIADTNNQRIRKVAGATITTVAGDGEELLAGDGAAATAAAFDLPTGIAVDPAGNLYVADRGNQRLRLVSAGGTISTLAGSGPPAFAGGFTGDGGSATAAALARPRGVSVDGAGNVYIADTGNQRIRKIGNGAIATVAGAGQQGFAGDSGPAAAAILNAPRAAVPGSSGNLAIADTLNQRLRLSTLPTLTFANDGVGVLSAAQNVTLANTGSSPITVSSIAFTGAFTTAAGGSCPAAPITLAAGASCTQGLAFLPTATGAAAGSVAIGAPGVVAQGLLLAGTGIQAATMSTLSATADPALAGQNVVFTAVVAPTGLGTPTGSVAFYDGATLLGTSALISGSASLVASLATGANSITTVYAGDANFSGDTSPPLAEPVFDFSIAVTTPASGSQTVAPGAAATYTFSLQPVGGSFLFPVTPTITGLPSGATATFTPQVIPIGAGATATLSLTIQTPASATLDRKGIFGEYGGRTLALGLLLLPFYRRTRSGPRGLCSRASMRMSLVATVLLLAGLAGLSGCGGGQVIPAAPRIYIIDIAATANGAAGATLQHTLPITLTLQ